MELVLALFFQNIVLSRADNATSQKPGLPRQKMPRHTSAMSMDWFHTHEGTVPSVDVLPCTSLHASIFQRSANSSVLSICTCCFPQLVPNCLVSRIFYCNFLCLIYFKVAKCFHKERTVKLFRNEEDSKTPVSFVSVMGSA